MKKTLTLVVLTGLMLTGCSGKQAASQPAATASAVAVVVDAVTVPGVMGLTLDKATDQLEALGFKVEAVDTADGKSILSKKNWQVTSEDPAEGAQVAKGSTVHLGVKHLTEATPTPTPTPAVVPPVVVAPPVPVSPPAPVVPPAVVVPPAQAPTVPEVPKPYGGIICKDGYAWPSATRQGACSGHGGIMK